MPFEFRLPDIGEGLTEAEIVEWLVAEGDTVAANQSVVEVETAKTTVEIPSPHAGTVTHLIGAPGDTIEVGHVLFILDGDATDTTDEHTTPAAAESQEPEAKSQKPKAESQEPRAKSQEPRAGAGSTAPKAMPLVRRLAKERGVDLATVVGTGTGGAITRADVEAAAAAPPGADLDIVPLTGIRRAIALHMTQSWTTIPHVTVQAELRAERLLEDRTRREPEPLPIEAVVGHAVLPLLREFPEFNAAFVDDGMIVKDDIHLGFAVDTDEGLVVVVVRDAASMTADDIASEFERLAPAAREHRASPDEMTGQTFTISNIGALGGGHGTPLIPVGTSSILSIGRAVQQPVVEVGELAVGWVAPLDLSYDHRLIDGGLGQRFLGALVDRLQTGSD